MTDTANTIPNPERPARRRRRPAKAPSTAHGIPALQTIEEAAATLRVTVEALRARCRRAAATPDADGNIVLAPGVFAVKLGKHWRVRFET